MTHRYYLDHNATTPLHPRVLEEMTALLSTPLGNPSSVHSPGRHARSIIDRARERLARYLDVDAGEIYFTSGGTESNNLVIHGGADLDQPLFIGLLEHPSVWEPATHRWGCARPNPEQGGVIPIDPKGILLPPDRCPWDLPPADTRAEDDPRGWASLQWINNETGHEQPIPKLTEAWQARGFLVHTDGAQAFFRVPTSLRDLGVDAATITAHKSFGPAGVGALFLRRGVTLSPILHGGPQERLLRPGTENLVAIHGLGALAEVATEEELWPRRRLEELQQVFRSELSRVEGLEFVGDATETFPSVCMVTLPDLPAEAVLVQLDRMGVAASSGAACASGSRRPSRVLQALGVADPHLSGPIRFSFGPSFTAEDLQEVARRFSQGVDSLRSSRAGSPAR